MQRATMFHSASDEQRFAQVTAKLSPYLDKSLLVTGSYAVEYAVRTCGGPATELKLNDIDVVAPMGLQELGQGLGAAFLVNHFHPKRELGNVLLQLIDPSTATRIDIFTPRSASIRSRSTVTSEKIAIVAAEDLTARLLAIVSIVLQGRTIDPKYAVSFQRLIEIGDLEKAAELWPEYRKPSDPPFFDTAVTAVQAVLKQQPQLLKPTEYSQDLSHRCEWCIPDASFPLADKRAVFELIGHV